MSKRAVDWRNRQDAEAFFASPAFQQHVSNPEDRLHDAAVAFKQANPQSGRSSEQELLSPRTKLFLRPNAGASRLSTGQAA